MIKLARKIYHKTMFGRILIFIYHSTRNIILSDELYVKLTYKKVFGQMPDLKNPRTLNEKIIWLKLNNRNPMTTICSDKFLVRDYISKKIGSQYLVPLYYQTQIAENIIPEKFPNTPFIIKTNHDSGGVYIIKDKSHQDWVKIRAELKKRLKKNYYTTSKEWQYKNIKPCIIVEKLLLDNNQNIPFDYKLHCFNGKVNMIQVDHGRGTENHYRNWYSPKWEREPYRWSSYKPNGKVTDPSDWDIKKPNTLKEMISLSEILAKDFDYVRVDWYDVNNKVYFGELTFHHDGGYRPILPGDWDKKLGDMLTIKKLK